MSALMFLASHIELNFSSDKWRRLVSAECDGNDADDDVVKDDCVVDECTSLFCCCVC